MTILPMPEITTVPCWTRFLLSRMRNGQCISESKCWKTRRLQWPTRFSRRTISFSFIAWRANQVNIFLFLKKLWNWKDFLSSDHVKKDHAEGKVQVKERVKNIKKVMDLMVNPDQVEAQQKDELNRMQRMLEETLTKNMHLQKDMENLSQEVVRLSKMAAGTGSANDNDNEWCNIPMWCLLINFILLNCCNFQFYKS